jgi:type I restriction-modification system DNA methylase subunit
MSDMFPLTDERTTAIDHLHAATAIYTKSSVIEDLMDFLDWPNQPGRLADPSCGDGAFLIEAIRRLDPQPNDGSILNRVKGWEIHPGACASARIAIHEYLCDRGWSDGIARSIAQRMVIEGDFLTDPPDEKSIRFIVGNPPFLRWSGIPRLLRNEYAALMPKYALGDILHAFLEMLAK